MSSTLFWILFWVFIPHIPTYFLMRWSYHQKGHVGWFPIPNIGWFVMLIPYMNLIIALIISIEIYSDNFLKENPNFHLEEYVFGKRKK